MSNNNNNNIVGYMVIDCSGGRLPAWVENVADADAAEQWTKKHLGFVHPCAFLQIDDEVKSHYASMERGEDYTFLPSSV